MIATPRAETRAGKTLAVLAALCLASVLACDRAPKQASQPGAGPQLTATVVTIRTTIGDQATSQDLVIANDRARHLGEQDVWRLFDTKANTVTYVDDIARTFRTESLEPILQKRRAALAAAIPSHYPRARLTHGDQKTILNTTAKRAVIQIGAYSRELWIGDHPSIPDGLFALMLASDPPASPLAPMMQRVDEELLRMRGFPLADRTEIPLGKTTSVIDRTVTAVGRRQVPEAVLSIPRGYRDLTPKPPSQKSAKR